MIYTSFAVASNLVAITNLKNICVQQIRANIIAVLLMAIVTVLSITVLTDENEVQLINLNITDLELKI